MFEVRMTVGTRHIDSGLREAAWVTLIGFVALACSALGGCALTRVEARRPASPIGSVAVLTVESGFALPVGARDRLSASLSSSIGARGQLVADVTEADCHVVATVERVIHHDQVAGGLHSSTDFNYGTYRIRLILLDSHGVQMGSAAVERDEFLDTMAHPEREEVILSQSLERASQALFVATPMHDLRASR